MKNALLIVVMLFVWAGCSSEEVETTAPSLEEIGTPPSLNTSKASFAVVSLDEAQAQQLDVKTTPLEEEVVPFEKVINGLVFIAPENVAQIVSPISGKIKRLLVAEGIYVRKGQAVAEVESLEFTTLATDYLQADAEVTYQQTEVSRLEALVNKGISAQKELDRATADLIRAQVAQRAAFTRLKATGISDAVLQKWINQEIERPTLYLYAPVSGMVDEIMVVIGEAVTPYQNTMQIVNGNKVHIEGYISPEEAMQIDIGSHAYIRMGETSSKTVLANVVNVLPMLEEEQRMARLHLEADTPAGWPKPGQQVKIALQMQSNRAMIKVPEEALFYEDDQAYVFVKSGAAMFHQQPIQIQQNVAGGVLVLEGVSSGDEVAVSQVFSLKALARYEAFAEE